MELSIYKIDGAASPDKIALPEDIFDVEPNDHAIYQDVRCFMTNNRQGTASSKNRKMVHGGGKKPWKQKGRGVARAGTIRSPLWVGGGRMFGPSPRDYQMTLPKKVKRLARKSALTYKARQNEIVIIDNFKLEAPKTKEIFNILKNVQLAAKKVLLVTPNVDRDIVRAGRNIPNLSIKLATDLCTYDILHCQVMLIQKDAVEKIKEVC
jgi:large subunit ribosomal protein L4